MNAGATFLLAALDIHLWMIISDPAIDPENVLIVNLTTFAPGKDQSCVLGPGDHPWIHHDSCVNYQDSQITTLKKLIAARDGGALIPKDPLDPLVLKKIRDASMNSTRMALEHADILMNQGLVSN
jgi:hypothetical protein